MNKIIFTFTIFLILIGFGNYSFATTADPVVVIETNLGNIVIELFPADATEHVKNFLVLSSGGADDKSYYDNTLFHRIIPGFMIQGGDPNTINGEPNTWGMGGPDEKLDAEFNSIKHNRGIVSMARGGDVNSAGSQFFIVHQDSPHLDGKYTAFGRLASEESFQTLDKIAAVTTGTSDRPIDSEQVRIIKTTIIPTASVLGYIPFIDPERTGSPITKSTGNQTFENPELGISFSVPEGWLLQQPDKNATPGAPDIAVVGPKMDGVNPVISLTITNEGDKTIDDLITEKKNILDEAVYLNKLEILSQEKIKTNVYQTEAIGNFELNDMALRIKFLEVMILSEQKSYTFAYSNTVDNFDNEFFKFKASLDSFKIAEKEDIVKTSTETSTEEINDTKTALDNGKIIYIKEYSDINEFKDIRLLEHPDYDLLQINYVYQHYEANDRYGTPFGSMKATSEFSLDYDSWPSYNYLATDEGTWMGTTMPGSDVVGAECPSYFSKSLNPNIPYTIIACYEIPKNVNYFYFEDILFSKSTIASSDYLKSTITQLSPESEEGGGCLIATATYGSEMAPQVQQLRELRDNQLLQTESGTAFMGTFNDIYYSFSPTIADMERENPLFKEAVKLAITPMISTLSLMENANSDSEVLSIGLSVIALNLGMYLGAPAIVIIGIRKKLQKSLKI